MVEEVGRLKVPGRPAIFSVTNEFLRNMGINMVEDLPEYTKFQNSEMIAKTSEQEEHIEIIEE